MTSPEISKDVATSQLKRLRQKAELCRFCHANMQSHAAKWNLRFKLVIAILSLVLSCLIVALYREIGSRDVMLVIIGFMPILIIFVQSCGSMFGWEKKEKDSAVAVHVWGNWAREADFLEKKIPYIEEEVISENISEVECKYAICMATTPSIPSEKFLCYKAEFKKYRLLSESIDGADIATIPEIMREICRKK